jgi:exosortase H (IPTLxxWG-CTERM-specific)
VLLNDAVQGAALHPLSVALAALSAGMLRALGIAATHREQVLAAIDGSFRVSIENDCNGAWAHLILLASVLSYPAPARAKLAGLLVTQALLFALNVARVVTLFFIGVYALSLFRAAHVYVWQFLIIGCAMALFLAWVGGVCATQPSLARVGLRLLTVFALATAAWPTTVEPAYDRTIAAVSLRVLQALERTPRIAGVRFEGHYAVIMRPAGADVGEQRLELRTHHNNVPLLVALMLAASGGSWPLRIRHLLVCSR